MRSEVFVLVLLFLVAGFMATFIFGRKQNVGALSVARWMMGLSSLVIVASYVSVHRASGRWFPANPNESHLFMTGILSVLGWIFAQQRHRATFLIVLIPLIVGILAYFQVARVSEVGAALPNPWIWIHILLMLAGETFFLLASGAALFYLLADYQMRHQRPTGVFTRISSLPDLDNFLGRSLLIGFILLSAGMACGFLFAGEVWAQGWLLDPKVIFCAVTWVLYGGILMLRWLRPVSKGRLSSWLSVVGLVGVLFLAWGVESIFPTQHVNYGPTSQGVSPP